MIRKKKISDGNVQFINYFYFISYKMEEYEEFSELSMQIDDEVDEYE